MVGCYVVAKKVFRLTLQRRLVMAASNGEPQTPLDLSIAGKHATGLMPSALFDYNAEDVTRKDDEHAEKPTSKNQLKKLKRQQQWEEGRDERKLKRREKTKAKKLRHRLANESSTNDHSTQSTTARTNHARTKLSLLPITIVIDCNFDDLMTNNECISLSSQLTRCYADNRKTSMQAHLAVSSWGGELMKRFDGIMAGQYKQWHGIRFFQEDFAAVAGMAIGWMTGAAGGKLVGALSTTSTHGLSTTTMTPDLEESAAASTTNAAVSQNTSLVTEQTNPIGITELQSRGEVIYLTSDSPNTLDTLKPYSTYIIGGIVDKNRHKGICYKRAAAAGVKTARLPIDDFMQMDSRKVLTTNHVNEIMLKWLELGDWGEAFMQVIPKRKGGVLKTNGITTPDVANDRHDGQESGDVFATNDAGQEYGADANDSDDGEVAIIVESAMV